MKHKFIMVILGVTIIFILAACGTASGPVAPASTDQLAVADPEPEADPEPVADPEPEADPEPVADPEPEAGFEAADAQLVIYSGRNESLIGPLIEQFEQESGIEVAVRYGSTAGMAATILEEGDNSPADLFYGQDAGALGALAKAGRFTKLSDDIINSVNDPRFRSPEGLWVGTSGRARTVIYNIENVTEADLPDDIFGFCDPKWKGRIGWAPTNGSFQAFVTALRVVEGEERAREWLECILANEPQVYPKNTPIVEAAGNGEIDVGFVNHYYLFRFVKGDPDFPARNYHPRAGDAGAMVNVAGTGILNTANNPEAAEAFILYMLSEKGQTYFNNQTNEYPLSGNIELNPLLTPLEQIKTPDLDLSNLDDLDGTLQLLQEVGAL